MAELQRRRAIKNGNNNNNNNNNNNSNNNRSASKHPFPCPDHMAELKRRSVAARAKKAAKKAGRSKSRSKSCAKKRKRTRSRSKSCAKKKQGDPVKKPTQQVTLQESLQESLQASKCQEPFKVGKIDHSRPIPSGQGPQGQSTLRQILHQKHFKGQEKMLIRTERKKHSPFNLSDDAE